MSKAPKARPMVFFFIRFFYFSFLVLPCLIDHLIRPRQHVRRNVPILDFRLFDHRITLSALAKTFGGIVNPICLAVLRLMMKSNLTGRSIGKSAALAPLRILSTYVAARRYMSASLGP